MFAKMRFIRVLFFYFFLSLILQFYVFPGLITNVGNFILFLLIASATMRFSVKMHLSDKINPENRAVLITGCDTGFGHLLAKRLDSKGFHVFASCLDSFGPGAKELIENCSKKLQVLPLDVTKDESVQNALKFITENLGSSELWAIVNNAGIYKSFGIELTSINDYKENFEVNAMGPVRVTKAFLPLLRQSRGRLINMTSTAGRIPLAHMSAYFTSKHALAGFTDCIRQELEVWGIRVISIEPDMFKTGLTDWEIISRNIDSSFQSIDDNVKAAYGITYLENFKLYIKNLLRFSCSNLCRVIDDMEDAVSLESPEIVYRSCRNHFVKCLFYIYEILPHRMKDLALNIFSFVSRFPKPEKSGKAS